MLHSATDRAFLASILEAPDDDAPRLIYADWLDEQGESDRADYVRLQIRQAHMAVGDPGLAAIRARIGDLEHAHFVEWVNRLPQFDGVQWLMFDRGFISAVRFNDPETFFARAAPVFDVAPIRELRLHQFNHSHALGLAATEQLRRIRILDLGDGNKIANAGTEALMESRHLRNLQVLIMGGNVLGSAGVRAIAMSGYVRNLRHLRLERNDLFDDGLRYVAESRALTGLQHLDLSRTRTGDDGVMSLAKTRFLTGLRYLDLSHNQLTDEAVMALAASPAVAELRHLFLHGNAITDTGVAALAGSPHLVRLECVFLRQNQIGDEGALALARSPHLGEVRELYLGGNPISDQAGDVLRARFRSQVNLY